MWKWSGKTDVGLKRENNQDSYAVTDTGNGTLLCVVCDGMGGAAGGSFASSMAVEVFSKYVLDRIEETEEDNICTLLADALSSANTSVYEKAQNDRELSGMGTTICAVLARENKLYCLSVGDSRIYLVKDGSMKRLSHDHSYVQTLIDGGQLTEEQARSHPNRNIITKAVGTEKYVEGDVFVLEGDCADKILVCSDGLCGYVDDSETADIINSSPDCETAATLLVDKANDVGGFDNITVVVMEKEKEENS